MDALMHGSTPPRIELVNRFRVGGCEIAIRRPARRLLAFLAASRHAMDRDFVAFSLWPEAAEAKAVGSLRTALWSLGDARSRLVETTNGDLALLPDVEVDVDELTMLAAVLDQGQAPEPPYGIIESFAGELLPGWYDEWALRRQALWREVRVRALETIAQRMLAVGNCRAALEAASTAVNAEPLRETSRTLLIRARLAEGNPALALEEARRFTALLDAELGIGPTPGFLALVASVVRAA